MLHRRLGRSGLKTSAITLGTGALHKIDTDVAAQVIAAALDAGVTHLDTAESYGGRQTEQRLGEMLKRIGVRRDRYILATKAFSYGWSDPGAAAHQIRSLNRKYLFDAIDRSLKNLGLDHVDIFYCHEEDPDTPLDEIARAMSDIVQSGRARYWAVSNWRGDVMAQVDDIARAQGLHRPIVNQIEYNMLHRATYAGVQPQAEAHGVGIAVWGPLAGGLLTGKYLAGTPQGSRAAEAAMQQAGISDRLIDEERNEIVRRLAAVAAEIGCTPGQMALAWCLASPSVCTVLTGASDLRQLSEILEAPQFVDKIADHLPQISAIIQHHDQSNIPEHLPKA